MREYLKRQCQPHPCCRASAQKTVIPDPFFEHALIYLNIDDSLDGTVLTENVSSLTELDLSIYGKITDLTGIQDFISLEILNCENHALTFLNLSSNLELRILNVIQNKNYVFGIHFICQ